MRIVLVVPGGVDRSGDRRVIPALITLVGRLSRRHDVQVVALNQEPTPGEWPLAGARIHNIGPGGTRRRAVAKIRALHRAAAVHVVHSIWSGSCGLVAAVAAGTLNVPCLIHLAGGELAALRDIRYGGRLTWRGKAREALVLRAATVLTAASTPMIEHLARLGLEARRVPLGVDLHIWTPRAPVPRVPGTRARLLHVASLNRVKDQGTLLRAMGRLEAAGIDFELDVIGEDTLQGEIHRLAAQLGLNHRVRFLGFEAQRELRSRVATAHVLVHSSRHEAGPLVMLEAAATGVPTVGTSVGHIAEWAPEAAIAVPVGDADRLARAIRGILEDEALRMRIANAALRRAVQEDGDYTAQRFEDLYREVCGT
jgi:glycosyltransferase involved in cell wall biosynthesis